jgi:hypothetical protein
MQAESLMIGLFYHRVVEIPSLTREQGTPGANAGAHWARFGR